MDTPFTAKPMASEDVEAAEQIFALLKAKDPAQNAKILGVVRSKLIVEHTIRGLYNANGLLPV